MNIQSVGGIFVTAALLVGCGSGGDDDDATPTETAAAATPALVGASGVTWHGDVSPLLTASCTRCHTDGGVGPGDFRSYETAAPLAGVIAAYTAAGLMPPPSADPSCRDYTGSHGMFLTEADKAILQSWADDGAPLGHIEDAPEPVQDPLASLDGWDTELRISPYQPTFRADGNMYTCFVLETGREDGFYITGLEAVIDQMEIVHHLVLMADVNGDVRDASGGKPFECFDDTNLGPQLEASSMDWTSVAAWAPGSPAVDFGEGRGIYVPPGAPLVLQMHYYESSPGASLLQDTSGYRLRTATSVDDEVIQLYAGPYDFNIPAGAASHSHAAETPYPRRGFGEGLRLLGTFPHMHVLGQSYRSWVEHADGSTSCMVEGRYDFYNQLQYMFKEPIDWKPGDNWVTECTWNNSTSNPNLIYNPPQDTTYGEGTGDEMCFFVTYATAIRQ